MAESVTIEAQTRDPAKNKGTGTRASQKLRAEGRIPAIVYGHKQDPMPISVARDDVWLLLKKATHLANLKVNGNTESVLVRDLQWDHLGNEILHVDFARVNPDETIDTVVKLVTTGTAKGTTEGGILEFLHHELKVSCRAGAIPDEIRIPIADLGIDQGIHVRDLKLPEGVTAKADADLLLLHITSRTTAADTTEEGSSNEPEVIGKKEKEEKEKDKEK